MESIETSGPANFIWKVSGEPCQIGLSLDVVRRIREYLAPRGDANSHQERGGLLLGSAGPQGVQIDNFVPLTADEEGLRYVHPKFGPRDLKNYIEELNYLAGPASVVGYFRGDFGKGVRLFEADLAFIEKYFPDRSNVFLVVRSGHGAPPSAGFFFWENGSIFTSCSFMEFTFDERALGGPADLVLATPEPAAPAFSRVRAINAGLAVTFGLLVGAYLLRPAPKPAPVTESRPAPKAGLAVSGTGKEVKIVWNNKLPVFSGAKVGMLSIKDGGEEWELPLTLAQLRTGEYKHTVKDETVEITLEIFGQDGQVTRESLTVISHAGVTPTVEAPPPPTLAEGTVAPPPVEKPRETVRRFVPPPSKPVPAAPPAALAIEPAPVATPVARVDMPRLDATGGPWPSAPAAPPKPAPVQAPQPTAVTPPPVAPPPVSLPARRPPIPVRQVRPTLPPNVQGMLTNRATIQIRVQVDAAGKVTRAEPVAAPGSMGKFLGAAASNAARLWTFEPALEGSKKIPGELVIEFTFGPVK